MTEAIDPARYAEELRQFRAQKDEFFASSAQSPIPAATRATTFGGLAYFAPDVRFRVRAALRPFANPDVVPLGSTKGDIRPQLRYGELIFTLDGRACRLTAYKDADDPDAPALFVPFRDTTSGRESYGAGRYLETEEETAAEGAERHTVLDFNLAYSPWCAYNEAYSCTLPPAENTLPVAVTAGERTFAGGHAS
jgi:uncharacterized protein